MPGQQDVRYKVIRRADGKPHRISVERQIMISIVQARMSCLGRQSVYAIVVRDPTHELCHLATVLAGPMGDGVSELSIFVLPPKMPSLLDSLPLAGEVLLIL